MLHSAPPLVHELIDARIHQYRERLSEAEYLTRSLRATARLIAALDPNQWIPGIHFAAARFQVLREFITQHVIESVGDSDDARAPQATATGSHRCAGAMLVRMTASRPNSPATHHRIAAR